MSSYRAGARLVAKTLGYFWLPCPLCGEEFGGHEWRNILGHHSSIPDPARGPSYGVGICLDCTAAGRGCAAQAAREDGWITHDCEPTRRALIERLGEEAAEAVLATLRGPE